MQIEFDTAKEAANIEKHGVSLSRIGDLDILRVIENTRAEDSERRFRLHGLIDGAAHCAVVTYRNYVVRAISLRKANRMERKRYGLEAKNRF
ncbi:MAG: BrnT family toxin [Pseudomonadota bacterium]|nr:BrnT family toxin [Pseudomonadota bacterium]